MTTAQEILSLVNSHDLRFYSEDRTFFTGIDAMRFYNESAAKPFEIHAATAEALRIAVPFMDDAALTRVKSTVKQCPTLVQTGH